MAPLALGRKVTPEGSWPVQVTLPLVGGPIVGLRTTFLNRWLSTVKYLLIGGKTASDVAMLRFYRVMPPALPASMAKVTAPTLPEVPFSVPLPGSR